MNILSNKNKVVIAPSIVVFTTFFLLGLYSLYYIRWIILLLFLSFIIAVALNPAVSALQSRVKLPRPLSIFLVYVLVISLLALILNVVVPPLINELYQLVKTINIPVLQDVVTDVKFTMSELSALAERVGSSVGVVMSIISSTFVGIFTFFTLIVISFYILLDRPRLHKKVGWFTNNPEHIDQAKQFIDSLEVQLGGWVRSQLILMTIIGMITYSGLALLGIPYALPLALFAGLMEILPNLGPTISAIPAVILAYASGGPLMAGIVALFYIVMQNLENYIIVPKLLKDNVDVNPLVSIVTILIGAQVAGVFGALLAIPSYIVIRTIYGQWFKKQLLKSTSS